MKFNVGKLNIKTSGGSDGLSGVASASIAASVALEKTVAVGGSATMGIVTATSLTQVVEMSAATSALDLLTSLEPSIIAELGGAEAAITLSAGIQLTKVGEKTLTLSGFQLLPGETLEIDLCGRTAEINGENVVFAVVDGSEFFNLELGANTITLSSDNNGPMSVTAYWKDRWR